MTYWYALLFSSLTLGAGWMTLNNVGMQDTTYTTQANSLRSSSNSGFYGTSGSGGFRTGK